MSAEDRKVDWEQVKRCIAKIDSTSREFLYQALLIGGAAVWFYRNQLVRANDPDFKIPPTSQEDDSKWLSRDIDFTGILRETAFLLLPANIVTDGEHPHIEVEGVRIGFAQVPFTIDPEEAFRIARPVKIRQEGKEMELLVADPLTLYFEKCYCVNKRGYDNDKLHQKLLFEYVAFELVTGAEKILNQTATVGEAQPILDMWIRTKNKAVEFLQDARVLRRLKPLCENKPQHSISLFLAEANKN